MIYHWYVTVNSIVEYYQEELRAETGRYKKLLEAANAPPPPPVPTVPVTRPAIPPVIAPALMAPMAMPHGTPIMYSGVGHPLVPQVPIACAPGFIPPQGKLLQLPIFVSNM